MIHTIRYFGNFDQSFHRLRTDTDVYFDREGKSPKPLGEVSDKVNGLVFRYMEMPGKEFVAVGVENIVLRAPVLLVGERHTDGKGFGPNDPQFEDDSAMRLLVDMIVANPERRDALGALVRGLSK
jgi:hypothetical protein